MVDGDIVDIVDIVDAVDVVDDHHGPAVRWIRRKIQRGIPLYHNNGLINGLKLLVLFTPILSINGTTVTIRGYCSRWVEFVFEIL
jgi:hypothetical protein